MRDVIVVLIILAVLMAGYYFLKEEGLPEKASIVNYPPVNHGPIIAFGDSLVSGVGAETEGGFVTLLSEISGWQIENFGRGGDTTSLALHRIDPILKQKPKVAIILLGGNDYLGRIPKEQTFQNLNTIIEKFQEEGSVVVLLGVRGGIFRDTYQKGYKKLAKETGSVFVPNVLSEILGKNEYMSDMIHPNESGHQKIAEKVYPALRFILE
jgi:acyl-CoA thioesterase I